MPLWTYCFILDHLWNNHEIQTSIFIQQAEEKSRCSKPDEEANAEADAG